MSPRETLWHAIERYARATVIEDKELASEDIDRAVDLLPATRHRLPGQRPLSRHELRIGGVRSKHGYTGGTKLFIQISSYPDGHPWAGRPGEVFIDFDARYEGSDLRHFANGFAMALSLLLQVGVPPEVAMHTFAKNYGGPLGAVDGHPTVKEAKSIIDLVAQVLVAEADADEEAEAEQTPKSPSELESRKA